MQQPLYGSSYEQLMAQIRKRIRENKVRDELFEFLQNASENAIKTENIVLSRLEKEKVVRTISIEILTDVLHQFEKA